MKKEGKGTEEFQLINVEEKDTIKKIILRQTIESAYW